MGTARIGVLDGVIAVGVAATLLVAALSTPSAATDLAPLGYPLLIISGLALVARRRVPIAVLAVTAASALGYQAVGVDVPAVAFLFAVYAAMRAGHRIPTVVASLLLLVALPLVLRASSDAPWGEALTRSRDVLELAWLIAAGAAGEALRQAERRADEAERTREETARRRADEERLHIARELHDSLTHQISVIKVQAEVAVHLATKRGDEVPESLLAIREAGREAARELRATLLALRDDDANPSPGLDQIPGLVQRAKTSGVDATLTVRGRPDDVPAAVGRTAYRIVQESLTNITRHADATSATVEIDHHPDALLIRVDDDGRRHDGNDTTPTPSPASLVGVGLVGMRERVAALGGHLHAGPRDGGGFRVQVELPVDQTS